MKILIVSQVIPQWYVDVLVASFPDGTEFDIITGSNVKGNIINSPKHDARSFSSRLICWFKHLIFMKKWIIQNKNTHYDLIFAVSNPPINSYIGLKLKKIFNAPFIYMNWDIYPQCIDYMIQNPLVHILCKLWHKWNNKNYIKIDNVLTIGEVIGKSINKELKNKIDVSVIPIGANCKTLNPIDKQDNIFCQKNDLCDKFIVLYSGKMGYGHNIELILRAAEKLRDYKDIVFVFIGEGQKYDLVKSVVDSPENTNVRLYPLQPDDVFKYSMACGDVGIIAEEQKMAHLFMPSKTFSMMACGMSIIGICSNNDDLYNLINEYGIGFAVVDDNEDCLCDYILRLYNDRTELEKLKIKSRKCAEIEFDVPVIIEKYRNVFEKYI